jgi:signal transduction histidine kinase
MLLDLRKEFRDTLDERLATSARMVAGLIAQMPQPPSAAASAATAPPRAVLDVVAKDGVACEISLLHGELIARTHNSPGKLSVVDSGYANRSVQGVQWRTYTLQQGNIRITTADRIDRRVALLHDIVFAMAVPFLIAVAGSLVALWFGIRRGLAPLETIRNALAERKPDALHPLPETRVPAELAPLVSTINLLLERVQHAIERERSFTGNAAHELRTPLTAVKTHLQVARLAGGDDAQLALGHAEEGVLRLQRTLEQLLMLARLEGPFPFGDDERMRVDAVVKLALRELAAELRHRVKITDECAQVLLAIPPTLAVTALRNLLDNALRYSPATSPVQLHIAQSEGFVAFRVADEGPGMSDSDRSQATRRFWRRGRGQGSGLGLSIVDAIVKRYGGELLLSARADGGMTAEISLPTT